MAEGWSVPFNPNNIHHITLVNQAILKAKQEQREHLTVAKETLNQNGIALIQSNDTEALQQLVSDLKDWK